MTDGGQRIDLNYRSAARHRAATPRKLRNKQVLCHEIHEHTELR